MLRNPHIKTAAAVALTLSAITPAAATAARPIDSGSATPTTQATPIVRVIAPQPGFDWADAGIGAAGGVALTMVGLGGALVASGRRSRRTQGTRAVTG